MSKVEGQRDGIDPSDRGLAYGDGLFETMACRSGRIRWLEYHLDRLLHGCARLAIPRPERGELRAEIEGACARSHSAVIKLIVTRGPGERGYAAPEPAIPTRILSIGAWPRVPAAHYTEGIFVKTCAMRLGENPQLAGLKHLCRLEQVLARMELNGSDAQEGILRSSGGLVVGGIGSNLFVVRGSQLLTPRLTRCGVRGVMRRVVMEHAGRAALEAIEAELDPSELLAADELFLTNAVFGIKPVRRLDRQPFAVGIKTRELMQILGVGTDA